MWISNDIVTMVDELATVHYVNVDDCKAWNSQRLDGEIRLLTGWVWTAKIGRSYQQGLKTRTVAYRDAYYRLCLKTTPPSLIRPVRKTRNVS